MRGTAHKEDQRWALDRAPAYAKALRALGRRRFRHAYRHLMEAERLLVLTEGNPPGVITSETVQADATEVIEEASAIDIDYDQEHYEHHAPRVRCFFHKGILICFTACEVSELITMTTFKLPDELHTSDADHTLQTGRAPLSLPTSRSGYIMELTAGEIDFSDRIWLSSAKIELDHTQRLWSDAVSAKLASTELDHSFPKCVLNGATREVKQVDWFWHVANDVNRVAAIKAFKTCRTLPSRIYRILVIK